jgi:hypothetical protein
LSGATNISEAWRGCPNIATAPETICANLVPGKVTNVSNAFRDNTGMTGNSYPFWNWATQPATKTDCYQGCVNLTDYATIPVAYL